MSKTLILDVQQALLRLDILASVGEQRRTEKDMIGTFTIGGKIYIANQHDAYTLSIVSKFQNRFLNAMGWGNVSISSPQER